MSWALSTQLSIFSLEAWAAELVLYRKCSCMFILTPLTELAEEDCKCYYTVPCATPFSHWEPLIQRKKGGGEQGWGIPVFLVNTILAQNPTFNNRALPLPCKIIFGIIFDDQTMKLCWGIQNEIQGILPFVFRGPWCRVSLSYGYIINTVHSIWMARKSIWWMDECISMNTCLLYFRNKGTLFCVYTN